MKIIHDWPKKGQTIMFPTASDLLGVICKRPGITLKEMHDMGLRSIFDALHHLLDEETIFETPGVGFAQGDIFSNNWEAAVNAQRYYPNN